MPWQEFGMPLSVWYAVDTHRSMNIHLDPLDPLGSITDPFDPFHRLR